MKERPRDQLQDLLRRKAQAASDVALRSGGQVSAEEVEALGRLARLVEISAGAEPQPTPNRWALAAALGGTLLIASALLFARVPETEIELDATLSEVSFGLPAPQVLAEGMTISAVGISGLSEIRLPATRSRDARGLVAHAGEEVAIRLAVASPGQRRGTINLAPIAAAGGSRVWLRPEGTPHQYRLSLEGATATLQAHVHGPVLVELPGAPAEEMDFATPKTIQLEPGRGVIDLDLTLGDRSRAILAPQLAVNQLSFFHVEQFSDADEAPLRRLSTILSGTIYLESLNGAQRALRPGEQIRLGQPRGELRAVRLHDDTISLRFHGRVRALSAGSSDGTRSLMPTWLEWLSARHGLSLLWGTTLYVFGLLAAVLRWLRVPA